MSSTFTPLSTFKEGTEKEWPAKLGALDWDKTSIVFTKRSLIDFLKYVGVSLDPNFHNVSKIPRYAEIGRMENSSDAVVTPTVTAEVSASVSTSESAPFHNDYKPSRRVRTVPGGEQTFRFEDVEEVLEPVTKSIESPLITDEKSVESSTRGTTNTEESTSNSDYKPSRRVRTAPGGVSSLANFWSDHPDPEPEMFKPTRRVRERPGGTDNMGGIL